MKAIFFDLDGTLLHFTRDYRDVLADTFRRVTGESHDEWIDSYNQTFFDVLGDCEPNPYRQAFATVGTDYDPETFAETLREEEVEMCKPPGNADTDLARLAENYKLGVLTNGVTEWQRHKLQARGLADYFDTIVASYEVGSHKPDTAPYRIAENRLLADAYAMVGDNDADIEGAKRASWTTYRYTEQGFGDLPDALEWE